MVGATDLTPMTDRADQGLSGERIEVEILKLFDEYFICIAILQTIRFSIWKMKTDYCCCCVEVACGDNFKQMIENSQGAFQDVFDRNTIEMQPTHWWTWGWVLTFLHLTMRSLIIQACLHTGCNEPMRQLWVLYND